MPGDYSTFVVERQDKIFIPYASAAVAGLMTPQDFDKLAALPSGGISLQKAYDGGNSITVDTLAATDKAVQLVDPNFGAASWNTFEIVDNAVLAETFAAIYHFFVDANGNLGTTGPFGDSLFLNFTLTNTSPATAAATVQTPHVITFQGRAYDTDDQSSRTTGARLQMTGVSGTDTSQTFIIRLRNDNGGAFATRFTFDNDGGLTLTTIGASSSTQHALPSGTGTLASLSLAQTWTASQNVASVGLTDGANIATDSSLGNVFTVTLGGNRTLDNPTNLVSGGTYLWIITQGAGGQTLAYGNLFKWPGGVTPTLSTGASEVDVITAVYNGTILCAQITKDFS